MELVYETATQACTSATQWFAFILERVKERVDAEWAAVFVAGLALLVTLVENARSRKHSRLMVRPHIDGMSRTTKDSYSYTVKNTGIGPAIIKSTSIYLDEKKIEQENALEYVVNKIADDTMSHDGGFTPIPINSIIPAGELIEICKLYCHKPEHILDEIKNRVYITAEYESFFEEKFTFDSRNNN